MISERRIAVSRHSGYFQPRRIATGYKIRRAYAGRRYDDAIVPDDERFGPLPSRPDPEGYSSALGWVTR